MAATKLPLTKADPDRTIAGMKARAAATARVDVPNPTSVKLEHKFAGHIGDIQAMVDTAPGLVGAPPEKLAELVRLAAALEDKTAGLLYEMDGLENDDGAPAAVPRDDDTDDDRPDLDTLVLSICGTAKALQHLADRMVKCGEHSGEFAELAMGLSVLAELAAAKL